MAERQVERGALVGPAPPRVFHLQRIRERFQRPRARQRQHCTGRLLAVVVLGVPGDILAEPLLPAAAEVDDGRHAREAARDRLLESLELVALDLDRKLREALP